MRFLIQRLQARICVWNSLSFKITQIKVKDKRNYLRCFIGRCDWFISEYDDEDLFFGYAIIGDPAFAEWGYISFTELKQIRIPLGLLGHQLAPTNPQWGLKLDTEDYGLKY